MTKAVYFPRRLILSGAVMFGILLALGVHILGQRFGLNLGDLWGNGRTAPVPAIAALAWWLIAAAAFLAGYFTTSLLESAASGQIPRRLRQFLIGVGVLLLAAAGQVASAPTVIPTISGLVASLVALCLGALMAFCGAHFALRRE